MWITWINTSCVLCQGRRADIRLDFGRVAMHAIPTACPFLGFLHAKRSVMMTKGTYTKKFRLSLLQQDA
jgi:hypothetical protein